MQPTSSGRFESSQSTGVLPLPPLLLLPLLLLLLLPLLLPLLLLLPLALPLLLRAWLYVRC